MTGEFEDTIEQNPKSKKANFSGLTFEKAIEMGEYDPEYLAIFSEWHQLTKHMKWHYVRQAIKNRKRFLLLQWAEIFNTLDFSKKPHLARALKNIEAQQERVSKDEERLQVEFSL